MFDSITKSVHTSTINGKLEKKYKKSFFIKTEKGLMEDALFGNKPEYKRKIEYMTPDGPSGYMKSWPVVIIQILVLGDGRCLMEIMWEEDYEELFEVGGQDDSR